MIDGFIVNALIAGICVSIIAGGLGCFIVWKKMAYFGDSLSHSSLFGIALGIVLGFNSTIGTFITCLVFAGFLTYLQNKNIFSVEHGPKGGDEINLNNLPIQTCWPGEPAPLITWPIVVTEDNGRTNLGIYRMQLLSKNKTLMRWLEHRGGAEALKSASQRGTDLPAAVVLGADPGTTIAAVAPVPEKLSEYEFSGLLRRKKLSLVKCKTVPLSVPAEAEIVLEGHVSVTDYRSEGPYGDHTGFYNSIEKFPVFTVSAVTMRQNPIYLTTFTGRPPDEPSTLGEALNDVFVPL